MTSSSPPLPLVVVTIPVTSAPFWVNVNVLPVATFPVNLCETSSKTKFLVWSFLLNTRPEKLDCVLTPTSPVGPQGGVAK